LTNFGRNGFINSTSQYVNLLAKKKQFTLTPGQFLGFGSTVIPLAYK
jgi:hypothetical protein